jgi:ABC-type transport system involved in cytochrome c biogenesis permease subunit
MKNKNTVLLIVSCLIALPLHAASLSNLTAFEDVAIQENGRSKPMLVFALETLRSLYGKDQWKDPVTGEKIPALNVVTELAFHPEKWTDRPLLRLDNLKLKKALGLPLNEKYFSYNKLTESDKLEDFLVQVLAHRDKRSKEKLEPILEAAKGVGIKLEIFESMAGGHSWTLVPHPSDPHASWATFSDTSKFYTPEQLSQATLLFQKFIEGYMENNQAKFDAACLELTPALRQLSPTVYPADSILKLEHLYTEVHPFRLAWIAYLCTIVILAATSLKGREIGYKAGWFFALLGFALQISGFVVRTIISGRAPVTNMYETVIWLGFGVMLFALIFEGIYRCRYFLLGAAPIAVGSLILADSLPAVLNSGIHPLVPVLRHNFWLTTHVLTITSSYAAFALALGVGHIILGKSLLKKPVSAALHQYLYRAIQIGVLLLGIGTLLGAVWANYSWGRFWDWDPKETWALIAFLSYVALLHGRLAGWWGGFGLAIGSILAFLCILMAWYGVNFILGTGLHSYGFGAGGLEYVILFALAEIAFVVFALIMKKRGEINTKNQESEV